jgi:hypothetical protein
MAKRPFGSPRRPHLRAGDGALVGWRYWRVSSALPDLLISPFRQTRWDGPVLTAHTWSTHDAVQGLAGIHATHTQKQARRFAALERGYRGSYTYTTTVAIGRVRAYGRYVVGTNGWRAERVIVDKLFIVPFPKQHAGGAIAAFEQRYHCPVRLDLRSHTMALRDLCPRCGHAKSHHRFPPQPGCVMCGSHGPCGIDDSYRLAILP